MAAMLAMVTVTTYPTQQQREGFRYYRDGFTRRERILVCVSVAVTFKTQ